MKSAYSLSPRPPVFSSIYRQIPCSYVKQYAMWKSSPLNLMFTKELSYARNPADPLTFRANFYSSSKINQLFDHERPLFTKRFSLHSLLGNQPKFTYVQLFLALSCEQHVIPLTVPTSSPRAPHTVDTWICGLLPRFLLTTVP